MNLKQDLERAWAWRESTGGFRDLEAVRVFHGPGEASGSEGSGLLIERFGLHFWITAREDAAPSAAVEKTVAEFLKAHGARSAVWLKRSKKEVPAEPVPLFGELPAPQTVQEGALQFEIRFRDTKHPGLFLDHQPLRDWLRHRAKGWRVLNLFAYTGSLSVAAGKGGAAAVTTVDLSKPTIEWAKRNWELNGLPAERARFWVDDVFPTLERLARKQERFDCVILDPPSFSRGKKGAFSTSKDLQALHERVFAVVAPGGWVITSINSENLSWEKYLSEVQEAARSKGLRLVTHRRIDAPETFPNRFDRPEERYLKGWILRALPV